MATVTITRTTPEPAADQRPPMLRLHLMTGAELMEMVERIANRRREFVKQIREVNTARVGDKTIRR